MIQKLKRLSSIDSRRAIKVDHGQGPVLSYLASLPINLQEELRKKIYNRLPVESNGSNRILGRAIAIKGKS